MTLMIHKSYRKDGVILNVGLNSTSKEGVLAFVRDSLARGYKFYIVTPNPEIVLAAQNDPKLLEILNRADISLPDGVGLTFAARFLGFKEEIRLIKGREIFMDLIKLANKKGWRVFLLGGMGDVAQKTAEILGRGLARVKIQAATGPRLNQNGEPASGKDDRIEKNMVKLINEFKPQLLFVGFGASKQEKWLYKWLAKLNVGGGMVVGGTFDYISGRTKLPPKGMEKIGLEWLWRLLTKPAHLKRAVRAVFVFPLKVLSQKISRN